MSRTSTAIVLERLAHAFPIWVAVACSLALVEPSLFAWFKGEAIVVGLAVIMLGMGMTLSLADFGRVASRPLAVVAGVVAQFVIMPAAGWAIATGLGLDRPLAVGLILVACCPGGTASNVVSFIARADVALSVVMTTCSTLAAVLLTPLLTALLAGQFVQVDTWGLFLSTVQVVILPVAGGVALNRLLPQAVASVLPIAPLVSVLMIALICGSIIAQNAAAVRGAGRLLLVAIVLLHVAGFGVGYLFARLVGYPTLIARTISIETGMQNSGLGVVLAQKHFASEPLTAVPGALSALTHSVIGSILAAWWRWQAKTDESPGIKRRIDDVADAGVAQTPGPDLRWSGDGDAGEVFTSVRAPAEQSLERVNRRRAGRLDAAPATGDAGRSPPR